MIMLRLGVWLSAWLACMKSWIPSPVPKSKTYAYAILRHHTVPGLASVSFLKCHRRFWPAVTFMNNQQRLAVWAVIWNSPEE